MGKCLFITGTGTDIGKTYVTGLIVKKLRDAGYNGGYYKAALSGAEPDETGALQPGTPLPAPAPIFPRYVEDETPGAVR